MKPRFREFLEAIDSSWEYEETHGDIAANASEHLAQYDDYRKLIRDLEVSREVLDKGFLLMRDRALDLHLQLMSSKERIHGLKSKLSDLVAYCKDGYGDHEADEIINAEKLLEQPR